MLRRKFRVVTKEFLKVPEVDYTETLSPVASDTSIRIAMGYVLFYENGGWVCEFFDVEAAFLDQKLDIEMYIE